METYRLEAKFQFEAAHRLPYLPSDHKCTRLHGHSFQVSVCVGGEKDKRLGWLIDFGEIQDKVQAVLHQHLDHYYLNEVPGLENPTSENIAAWLWNKLEMQLPGLCEITVGETCETRCLYRKDL